MLPADETMPTAPPPGACPAGAGAPLYGRTSTSALALTPRAPVRPTIAPGAPIDWNRSRPLVIRVTLPDGKPPVPDVSTAPPSVIADPVISSEPPARDGPLPPCSEIAGAICTVPRARTVSDRPLTQPAGSPASRGFTGSGTQQLCSCARGPMYSESTFRTVLPVSRSVELM